MKNKRVNRPSTVNRRAQTSLIGSVTVARSDGEDPCQVLWETPMGSFWGRSTDGKILKFLVIEQLQRRIYQNDVVDVSAGDVVLDVGSHLGTFTRAALDRGAKTVVAFDPDPINTTCFKRTFQQELADRRVILVEAAVWKTSDTLTFEVSVSGTWNSGIGKVTEGGTLEVRAVTIDETVEDLGLGRIDFVKMDIEGGERHALAGGRRSLARFAPRMALCIYHLPDDRFVLEKLSLDVQPDYRVVKTIDQAYFFR